MFIRANRPSLAMAAEVEVYPYPLYFLKTFNVALLPSSN
jgi:hypothetical protein